LKCAASRGIIGGGVRADPSPNRTFLASLLCAAVLAASLAPCPPPARSEHAVPAEHPAGCEMHESAASVTAACPCGCGERVPTAGSSARLGVALASAAPSWEPPSAAAPLVLAPALLEGCFSPPIDHVPLPA
jgi:hypothetical protein